MWVNQVFLREILTKFATQGDLREAYVRNATLSAKCEQLATQKAKDDTTIEWLMLRCNEAEAKITVLLRETSNLHFPMARITPQSPLVPSISPNFERIGGFEDMGDEEATKAGLSHDPMGYLNDGMVLTMPKPA